MCVVSRSDYGKRSVSAHGASTLPTFRQGSLSSLSILVKKNERCHNEIGAPDYRISIPFGVVLTPWDQNLFPVFGPVATAQEDSWRLDRVKSRPVSAFGYCGFTIHEPVPRSSKLLWSRRFGLSKTEKIGRMGQLLCSQWPKP